MNQHHQPTARRGRPPGSRKYHPADVIRVPVHLTVHRQRQPRLAAWLTEQQARGIERGLATDLVDLIERALAGGQILIASGGEQAEEVYEVDMSGLMDWD